MKKNMMALIKYIIISIVALVILLYVTFFVVLTIIFGKPMNSNKIINIFKSNEKIFNESLKELNDEKDMKIGKNIDQTSYLIEKFDDNYKNSIKIDDENKNYINYKHSTKLMDKLKLTVIRKTDNNIEFGFNSMIKFGQYIVNVNDLEKYKINRSVIKMKKIKNKWYYVELD